MNSYTKSAINKVKRGAKRAYYDVETVHNILDKHYVCYVSYLFEGTPITIPTAYGSTGDKLYIHGAFQSRMLRSLLSLERVSLTVSSLNGLVLARSAFHHSVNYESVTVFGKAREVLDRQEKMDALECITNQIIPGRWEEIRLPNEKELGATLVIEIPIEQASAKIRTGGPIDDKADYDTHIWAGEIPIVSTVLPPIPDEKLGSGIDIPSSVKSYMNKG